MNFCASVKFLVLDGIAKAQDHNQFAPLFVTPTGDCANATLSATFDCAGSEINYAAIVASIHIPHLPSLNKAKISLKLFPLEPGGPYLVNKST